MKKFGASVAAFGLCMAVSTIALAIVYDTPSWTVALDVLAILMNGGLLFWWLRCL